MNKIMSAVLLLTILSAQAFGNKNSGWKNDVPQPVFEQNKDYVDLYWKAWETANTRVMHQDGLPQSPYMDEACWDSHIWIWDTAFMAFFTKYSPAHFPGVESLKNFYGPMHDGTGKMPLKICHPDNPPLFAWCEYNNWKFNGATSFGKGKQAVKKTISYLIKHFEWFDSKQGTPAHYGKRTALVKISDKDGNTKGFRWNGVASGMDNTVRGRGAGWENTLWIDAISQQALSALYISRMAKAVEDEVTAKEYKFKYEQLKDTINTLYWDEEDGTYYDIHKNSTTKKKQFVKVLTPASIWPLLAEAPTKGQAKRVASLLQNPGKLGGPVPVVTLSRDDQQFNAKTGDYWRGGIWLPTTYMAVKALEKYGMRELAAEVSMKTVQHMIDTYKNPEAIKLFKGKPTIWECYSPSKPLPSTEHGRTARPEFCGWSALGPISLFIENILGFYEVDSAKRVVKWNLHQKERHGIKQLRFSDIVTDIIADKGKIEVTSNKPYTLKINGISYEIKKGNSQFSLK